MFFFTYLLAYLLLVHISGAFWPIHGGGRKYYASLQSVHSFFHFHRLLPWTLFQWFFCDFLPAHCKLVWRNSLVKKSDWWFSSILWKKVESKRLSRVTVEVSPVICLKQGISFLMKVSSFKNNSITVSRDLQLRRTLIFLNFIHRQRRLGLPLS